MKTWHPFAPSINLHVTDAPAGELPADGTSGDLAAGDSLSAERISAADAARQTATAGEVLRRLAEQPGIVLADEVGMGKTFVALAVAASVALSNKRRAPVVVMVPPSLKQKWPRDFAVFQQKCLPAELRERVTAKSADNAVEFLRLLDDPPERRCAIIFLTHGAMHRGLTDSWVKLAIIQRALKGRHNTHTLRTALQRCLGRLLQMQNATARHVDLWERLLDRPPAEWRTVLQREGFGQSTTDAQDGGADSAEQPRQKKMARRAAVALDDDPVPAAVVKVLANLDTSEVYKALQEIPHRQSATWVTRVNEARGELSKQMKSVWRDCITQLGLRLPLLILDEAHHLKNATTHLAGLFQVPEAQQDVEEVSRGVLGGVFERMLFLTATPFQLGHHELCSVLERFAGIDWKSSSAPALSKDRYERRLQRLHERLDRAQFAALQFDAAWGKLRPDDLLAAGRHFTDVEAWWSAVLAGAATSLAGERALAAYRTARRQMYAAEVRLRPWVIRHLKPRQFERQAELPRRVRYVGAAILDEQSHEAEAGLPVQEAALLPFLLAARATVCMPEARPVFAEGLASSYEAFRHTRRQPEQSREDDDPPSPLSSEPDRIAAWYLDQLTQALPQEEFEQSAAHPKVAATADRALQAWRQNEKVVIFCHYIQTGSVLQRVISHRLQQEIVGLGAKKIGCAPTEVDGHLKRLGKRFFVTDSPAWRACDQVVERLLAGFPELQGRLKNLQEITRRFLRTPSFLVRYLPSEHLQPDARLDATAIEAAFEGSDGSGLQLRRLVENFFEFLARRCVEQERDDYLAAIDSVQTGAQRGPDDAEAEDDSLPAEVLLRNVRLVNGATRQETRQRLMLTFNSPFFPEILISSSVLAEGVDLHRYCRYVIHHDLCWNPSTLEQRTGRVDRIGGKHERCTQPVQVYLPYLAATQDEKMYRVVMDRERWFGVVMGEHLRVDARNTERLAERIPLPRSAAEELAFRLEAQRG